MKYKIRFIVLCFIAGICGMLLADFQFQKWQERKAADAEMMKDYLAQPIVYQREETVDVGVIYEDIIEFREMTDAERDLLMAKVVMAEAGNQPFVGQVAVASVILNRMDAFGMTTEEVVYQKNQFASPAENVTESCKAAVQFAKTHRDLFPVNMLYFRSGHYHSFGDKYTQIGDHYFSTDPDLEVKDGTAE